MSSSKLPELFIPDVNVWFALTREDHEHRDAALQWWRDFDECQVGLVRVTQFGLLRLLTNPVAMNRRPLSMVEAWRVYERLFHDDRVRFLGEPMGIDAVFKKHTSLTSASYNLWADRWLLAFAEACNATLVTCDKALAKESKRAHLLLSSD